MASQMINRTRAWRDLASMRDGLRSNLGEMFRKDPKRSSRFMISTDQATFDFSRQLVTPPIIDGLLKLAEQAKLKDKIQAMRAGEVINVSEHRAVLHMALRNLSGEPIMVNNVDVMPEVNSVLERIKKLSEEVLNGKRTGVTGKRFKNILAIGIGGSCLGPEYLAEACRPYAKPGMNLVFLANVDGTDFARKTKDLDPEETLVVVISKTFKTAETMINAETVKKWMLKSLGNNPDVIKKHFIAVSTAKEKVEEFGIDPENAFPTWSWVGGRFSATSAVGGVPLSLYLGFDNFHKILEGANAMDRHFLSAPFGKNIPVMAALLDIWNINFMGYKMRAILPYSQALHKYAAHCQQVEMESNGKSVDIKARKVTFDTSEVVFGEPGTLGQHSFYQLMHQGTTIVPADFIGFINPQYNVGEGPLTHHDELMSNFFAQPDALAFGQRDRFPQKVFTGNRPSNVFLLRDQDPYTAGMLLALLEHRVAVKGFIWGINSFDQFGVELGKVKGLDIRKRIELYKKDPSNPEVFRGLNPSSAALLKVYLKKD